MKPSITLTNLPSESTLHARISSSDFVDCYSVPASLSARHAAKIITNFPSWTQGLLAIRKVITAPFGLSTDGPIAEDKLGPFPVESETDNELIIGFNDKHLNFRVSVISQNSEVFLATWVHPHNIGGHLYLKCIMPFHILVVRNALKRVAIENKETHTDTSN